jgi:ferredoxin
MALAIDMEECVICGACEPVCPNQAISHDETTFMIDAKACTECQGFHNTPQCVLVCPVDCIHPVVQLTPIPTVRRAKLFNMVIGSFNRPDSKTFK